VSIVNPTPECECPTIPLTSEEFSVADRRRVLRRDYTGWQRSAGHITQAEYDALQVEIDEEHVRYSAPTP